MGSCCTQLLWMKQIVTNYGIVLDTFPMFCNNTSAINISKNPVQHSKTKHFDTGVIIAQIYVDDILFGSTSSSKVQEFVN